MAIQCTNQEPAQALKGQSVKVTLNGAEAISVLPQLKLDQQATVTSSGFVGFIKSIDARGLSFMIAPRTEAATLASTSTPGFLAENETINIE